MSRVPQVIHMEVDAVQDRYSDIPPFYAPLTNVKSRNEEELHGKTGHR